MAAAATRASSRPFDSAAKRAWFGVGVRVRVGVGVGVRVKVRIGARVRVKARVKARLRVRVRVRVLREQPATTASPRDPATLLVGEVPPCLG